MAFMAKNSSHRDEILNLYGSRKWESMPQFNLAVHEKFKPCLRSEKIPPFHLSHQTLEDGSLVRYRCLIHNHLESPYVPPVAKDGGEEIPAIVQDPYAWPQDSYWWDNPSSLLTQNVCTALPVPGEQPWIIGEEYGKQHLAPPKIKIVCWTPNTPSVASVAEVVGVYYKPRGDGIGSIYAYSWESADTEHHLVPKPQSEAFKPVLKKFRATNYRSQIINYISECIGGNKLVAEYFLMQMCSSVFKRTGALVTGKLSINLTGVPPRIGALFVSRLHACLATLVPRVISLNMHGTKFEQDRWVPVKDHETNTLSVAPLMCANRTHLIINATNLKEGTYGDIPTRNIKALNDVITQQIVYYDFVYSQLSFMCDIPVTVVSEGKAFYKTDVVMSVGNISEDDLVEDPSATEEQLHQWRQYIACARRLGKGANLSKSEELTNFIAEDLSKVRRRIPEGEDIPALHMRICIARLLALTHLEEEIGIEEYARMVDVEDRRLLEEKNKVTGGAGFPQQPTAI